ncbi:hypothetical protein BDF20DRAFT_679072 [Mycotypha africana]|uniref:uncharacterized protein n=1 Tax=Mycotypha africana TaxID=64632 RepID=UPI002301B734|nr:uncharacterized protein BDF20DRAFT_679072 [Mycotypha africana]KAI8971438.1 hypothetical protein BDF20DRAFT_679072 [Mycotypha africana]
MTFGTDLKDQIPLIVKYVGDGIESLHQFRSFLKERSNIEREYAQKLEQLSKKYKSQHNTSVKHFLTGADPSQQQQPVKKEDQSTTLQAWNHLLKQTGHIAKIRFRLAEDINDMIVEALRETAVRKEECRRKHAAFYQRLKSERDKTYAEKDRAKQAYDEACLEIENLKAKKARGGDSEKLQRQIDAATLDCYNKKNLYLLAVNIANAERSKYFDEDIPILADVG